MAGAWRPGPQRRDCWDDGSEHGCVDLGPAPFNASARDSVFANAAPIQVDARKIQGASFKLTKYRGGGRGPIGPIRSYVIVEAAREGSREPESHEAAAHRD
jgi:hypothetical protein